MNRAGKLLLGLLLMLQQTPGSAATVEALLASGKLQASIVIDTAPPLLQRSPVVMAVEIATPRWFSRGTRVADFRATGALVRPVSSFADNQTRLIDGESWSVQRWRFRIYAQAPGPLALPPLRVFVSVNTQGDGVVEGTVELMPPALEILSPPGTDTLARWLATPELRISESRDGELEDYRAGDAITRIRRYRVQDAPAMMLESDAPGDVPGLSLYSAPVELRDSSDRGQLVGERIERLVVTMEEPGDYELPGLEYAWFNLRSGKLETVRLEPYRFSVRGAASPGVEDPAAGRECALREWLPLVGSAVLLSGLLWLLTRSAPLRRIYARGSLLWQRVLQRRAFQRAVRSGDSEAAITLLHRAMIRRGRHTRLREAVGNNRELQDCLARLMAHAYGRGTTAPDMQAADPLWRAVTRPRKAAPLSAVLTMNPRSPTP